MGLNECIRAQHSRLVVRDANQEKYRVLKDFSGTYIAKQMDKEERMLFPIFRVFECVKPEKGRKLNIDPEHAFDPYSDSLMDYPSIIGSRLKKEWNLFNRLISVHIPLCPNNCWHCYLPKELYEKAEDRSETLDAKDIVEYFLKQRSHDKISNKESNVLRITGGEPFLLPELTLKCLQYLREKGLENEVFIWTETNLEPFIYEATASDPMVSEERFAFMEREENKEVLKQLGTFRNLAVHPCFHGLGVEEFKSITGKEYEIGLDQQITGLRILKESGLDIYPTFGSNVCDPAAVPELFRKLQEIHPDLPLRVALVEYDLSYEPIKKRIRDEKRKPKLFSKYENLRLWNTLLLQKYGVGYAVIPRHLISIISGESKLKLNEGGIALAADQNIIPYLIKSSYRAHYHRQILDILALPNGHIVRVDYDKKWIQKDLWFHMESVPSEYEGCRTVWVYFDKDRRTFLPFRNAVIKGIEASDDTLSVIVELGNYIGWPIPVDVGSAQEIGVCFKKYFGPQNIAPNKYVILGRSGLLSECSNRMPSQEIQEPQAIHQIAPYLISCSEMKRSLFYGITTEGLMQKEKKQGGVSTIYEIVSGDSFKIKLAYFLPNYAEFDEQRPEERTIQYQSSDRAIKPVAEPRIVFSKYGTEEIEFITEKVEKKREVTISFWSGNDEFKAARVVLHILLLPPKVKRAIKNLIAAIMILLTTGGLAIGSQALEKGQTLGQALRSALNKLFGRPFNIGNLLIIILLLGAYWISLIVQRTSNSKELSD